MGNCLRKFYPTGIESESFRVPQTPKFQRQKLECKEVAKHLLRFLPDITIYVVQRLLCSMKIEQQVCGCLQSLPSKFVATGNLVRLEYSNIRQSPTTKFLNVLQPSRTASIKQAQSAKIQCMYYVFQWNSINHKNTKTK